MIHDEIKRLFLVDGHGSGERGFLLDNELAYNPLSSTCDTTVKASVQVDAACLTATRHGPVYVRDGVLSFVNADTAIWPDGRLPTALW
jgi:hypothetical protein